MQQKRYQTAVERVLNTTKHTGPLRQPGAPIPDDLIMPDGRRYNVRRLLEQVGHPHNITVGVPRPPKTGRPKGSRQPKYGPRDFEFMAHATLDQIQQRYNIVRPYCRQLQLASIKYIARNGYSDTN
jgi:hypothetical protein